MISLSDYFSTINTLRGDELSAEDEEKIGVAFDLAEKFHAGQIRANGASYFEEHCVPVSYHVASLQMDAEMISAALLHDTLEDTKLTMKELIQKCGADVAFMVDGVSKLGKVRYKGNDRNVESLRKFFVAIAKDVRVVILKMCDRWHNLETLQYLAEEKRSRIARESILIHAQLASRLNMGQLANTLKDLAFPYAYPEEYERTKLLIGAKLELASKTVSLIHKQLGSVCKRSLGYEPVIDERVKGLYSTYQKLVRKDWNTSQIYDLIALRIIVDKPEDCYVVLGAIHATWRPMPGRLKDYIALPKPNGYKSLHTVILDNSGSNAEIQIRTKEMHTDNEYGVSAHHTYKSNRVDNKDSGFDWLEQLNELKELELSPEEYIQELSADFFETRIFVLTPKGDVIDLPQGATALDFAFAVHSEIAEHASGAIINGVRSSIDVQLESESVIEIETSDKITLQEDWRNKVLTSRAKSKIGKALGRMEVEGR